ncbi:MAG: glycosyltransferase [Deltaproteobacteria bacterium]|jgi:glycosyltransferase involved in cell wall biosynthesis|nr:glycosyltransferase [Deltaproteobacteria bacterium]
MDHPFVSVIIPTYNRIGPLRRAIDSVLTQKEADFELIVVDDGSTDQTTDVLSSLVQSGLIKLIALGKNCGVSAARNAGIKAAQGELVAFLDSDDQWMPEKLKAQVDFMAQNPSLMISQCQERWIRNGRRVNPGTRHLKAGGDIFIRSLSLCLISPSAVIMDRKLFSEVGFFDESLPAAEDYDLWLRVCARRQVGLLNRELVVRYSGHLDQLSAQPGLDRYRIRALKKILLTPLPPAYRAAAEAELARRKAVYETGRRKRAGPRPKVLGEALEG